MTVQELKQLYFNFFIDKGHALIPSASLLPVNDATALFVTAGMQPLVPNLMGEPHPSGERLVDVQKCLRTIDIEEVGDDTHLTLFEMLGNWSLGDYFKKESIAWSWEFLTSEQYLNINPDKLYISVFGGEEEDNLPKDEESAKLWEEIGVAKERIFFLSKHDNFWGPVGDTGPCGPDTEIFYWVGDGTPRAEDIPGEHPGFIEIWNNVFMEYFRKDDGSYQPLKNMNVDTGMGVERTVAVLDGKKSVYHIDVFVELLDAIRARSTNYQNHSARIIADHIRAATFLLADDAGLDPSNKDQGYILRRLIRRAVRHAKVIDFNLEQLGDLSNVIVRQYHRDHAELQRNAVVAIEKLNQEKDKFLKTLDKGLKEFEKIKAQLGSSKTIDLGAIAFDLFQSYGFPLEMFLEELKNRSIPHNPEHVQTNFEIQLGEHQAKSRTASAGKFKGGLADHSDRVRQYHTTNHMMLEALRRVLGDHVAQKGSNITAERLRFDFSHPKKMTEQEISRVEEIVNQEIAKHQPVHFEEMSLSKAREINATGVFDHKYGDTVKVYFVGDYSKEICGGPHVDTTEQIKGQLKIIKEEASSQGIRRIKAVLQ